MPAGWRNTAGVLTLWTAPGAVAGMVTGATAGAQSPDVDDGQGTDAWPAQYHGPVSRDGYADLLRRLPWQRGSLAELGEWATVRVPEGFKFLGADAARELMAAWENIPTGREEGLLAPDEVDWAVVFEFDPSGFVPDDDKNVLDSNLILDRLRANERKANKQREAEGFEQMFYSSWVQEPRYDPKSNRLEWGVRLRAEGGVEMVNYETKMLGRHGFMEVTLICTPAELEQVLPRYRTILEGFKFQPGKTYQEFHAGDRLASRRLIDLIVDGRSFFVTSGTWPLAAAAAGFTLLLLLIVLIILIVKRTTVGRKGAS